MNLGPNDKPYTHDPSYNVIWGAKGFDKNYEVTHPTEKISDGKNLVVIDSRQRDCNLYPSPSFYRIPIGIYKNVTSIELKGSILPKTAYNVHNSNNQIDFSIGDTVTSINITNGGSGYTIAPTVTITNPSGGGVTATATAVLSGGSVSVINIVLPGSGYRTSNPPAVIISAPPNSNGVQATAKAMVGTIYNAYIRPGNYIIGGNPQAGVTTIPTELLLEIQNAMNYAVNGSPYNPTSTSPFAVRVVSQYPELGAVAGTPEAFDTNACLYNRIQITNVNSDHWELLWCSGKNSQISSRRILGFPWIDQSEPTITAAVNPGAGDIIPAGSTLRGLYDYDLSDDPNYAIFSFWAVAEDSFERLESDEKGGLDRAFATMVYDANIPDNLFDLNGTTNTAIGGVTYLEGDVVKGNFYRPPGTTKPLKGFDFDKKYLEFSPAIGKLSYLNIQFNKFGSTSGGLPHQYDFMGRDHLLIFEISSSDQRTGQRWS